MSCSPHPRGWSQRRHRRDRRHALLPAPAGMVPRSGSGRSAGPPAPRTRGDGPFTRPMASTSPICSPHPRGWSQRRQRQGRTQRLLPAPAGMVPPPSSSPGSPRAAPRTRGDGPEGDANKFLGYNCSPHPRGWSPLDSGLRCPFILLPAPAGMVPLLSGLATALTTAPRTRGDGPTPGVQQYTGLACSPHPRGWSPGADTDAGEEGLLPAPAGMVPCRGPTRR